MNCQAIVVGAVVLVLSAYASAANAQTPIPTYDGVCRVDSITALTTLSGSRTGKMSFSCSGTFYGKVRAHLVLERVEIVTTDAGWSYVSPRSYTAEVDIRWPRWVQMCSGSYCYPYQFEPIPATYTMKTSTTENIGTYRARGHVAWETGPPACTPMYCVPTEARDERTSTVASRSFSPSVD
jgi:hypothetical protein